MKDKASRYEAKFTRDFVRGFSNAMHRCRSSWKVSQVTLVCMAVFSHFLFPQVVHEFTRTVVHSPLFLSGLINQQRQLVDRFTNSTTMPPSDDTKELMTANNNSAGGGLSSSSSSIVASATSLAADEISSINSSTFIPAMSLTLQDHLSIVFETKRNSTMDKEKMQNLEDGVMAAAAAELSTDGSDSTVFTTALPSELEQQQPATSSLTEQGGEDPAAQQEECTDSQEHVPVGDDSLQSETSAAATSKDDNDDSEKSDDHGSSSSSENIAKGEPEKKEADGPLAMLRKGAVAAVGGTMVSLGGATDRFPFATTPAV